MSVIILTDQNFDAEVIKNEELVLVDMYSEWCPPCQLMHPIIEELAEKLTGKIKVGKLDVDANEKTASFYKIKTIPTFLIFKKGEVVQKTVGAGPITVLESAIRGLEVNERNKDLE
ncbi:MAG: thioredoxin [bacterium]